MGGAVTILRIISRHVDRETYDAINAKVDVDRNHPLGLIMHGASEVDGTMQIAQIWDSEEYARRFDEERLKPAFEAVGASMDGEITIFALHHLVTP
jgi:hypothetical protein